MRMRLTSPRSTQLYQMLASGPISTSPISRAPGATKAAGSTSGALPPKGISSSPLLAPRSRRRSPGSVGRNARVGIVEVGRRVMPSRSIRPQLGSFSATVSATTRGAPSRSKAKSSEAAAASLA